jgi:hypothetical protein
LKTLRECLADYDTTLLRAIAERRGVELTTHHQPEMVEEITAALLDPHSLSETLAWLTDQEHQALETLLANDGRLSMHRFTQQFGEIRRFGPGKLAREAPWRAPISVAEGLWYQGLISRSFAQQIDLPQAGVAVEFAFIPSDLIPLLPPPQAGTNTFARVPSELQVSRVNTPHTIRPGIPTLVDDLCTLLSLVQSETVRLREDELPPEVNARLAEQFLCQDQARMAFLYHLAQAAELLCLEGHTLRLSRERVRGWLKGSRAEQIRYLQRTWRNDATYNDLWHVPGIRCENTGWRNDPLAARQVVLGILRRCPIDTWLSIPGFIDTVHEQFPDYLRPDGDFESWYIRDARTGEYLTGVEHWDRIEGGLLTTLLCGPLHWLGVTSLGYKEGWQKPSAIQLSPWGAAFLDLPQAPMEEPPTQPAHVTPEGQVTLAQTTLLFDRFQLARIAEWRASGSEYVYVITPSSLRRALSADIQTEMIEKFLQRISQDNVPAAAVARIRAWTSRYGHVSLRRAAILETRSPQVMVELRAHGRIRPYLRQVLSPTAVLVREGDWDILIEELEHAGYLPKVMSD